MKIILTALPQEARPLIDALGLKQDPASSKIPIYTSGDTLLAISGMGKLFAGIAATHLIHLAGVPEDCHFINVGMCGAVNDQFALGEAVIANKIRDNATGREFFPEMLVHHSLREASLGTFNEPVTAANRSKLSCDIVDMEASGVIEATHLFLGNQQLLFVKVVTDYLEFSSDDYSQMLRYYENSLQDWLPMIQSIS